MMRTNDRGFTLVVTAGILLAFAVVDYWTPTTFHGLRGDYLGFIAVGICIAQVTLIATWAVFAPGNIVVRLPWSLLLGLMMWYVLTFGQQRSWHGSVGPEDSLTLGVVLLLGVTVLQVPLWIAKRAFRYRMLVPGEVLAPVGREPAQFQLKHLILGTFLLSVALSPIRLVLPVERMGSLRPNPTLAVSILAVIVVNLVATLPCLWGGFVSARRAWWLAIAWTGYSFGLTVAEFAVLCAVVGDPLNPRLIWEICVMNFTQGLVVFAVMRGYRALGYRLQRAPRAVA